MTKQFLVLASAALFSVGIAVAQQSDTSAQTNGTSTAAPMQSNDSTTGSSTPNAKHKKHTKVTTKDREGMDSQAAKDKNNSDPASQPNTTSSRKDQSSTSGATTGGSTSTPDYSNNPK